MGQTEAEGKEVQGTTAPTKLNQMSGGPSPSQGNGPLLAGAGADVGGGKNGGDAEEDEAKKRAIPAKKAKKAGKSSGLDENARNDCGDPVDAVSGCVVNDTVDLELPGAFPFMWKRGYSSARTEDKGALGRGGWVHSYEQWVEVEDEVVTYRSGDGRDIWFDRGGPGEPAFHRRERLTLTPDKSGGFLIDAHDERLRYEFRPVVRGGRAWLVAIHDLFGHRITFEYDGPRLIRIVDTAGREIRLLPTPQGYVRRVEVWASPPAPLPKPGMPPPVALAPRLQQWIDYAYHDAGELSRAADALGQADSFDYDAYHRMVKTTLKNGVSFHYRYDEDSGRCVKAWGDGGLHEVDFHYDVPANTTRISATNEPRLFVWNDDGLVIQESLPDGQLIKKIDFDADLYVLAESNGAGHTWRYEHDERGNRVKATDPAGNITLWEYANGAVVRRLGPDGLITTYARDRHGSLMGTQLPTEATYRIDHDAQGRVARVSGPDGLIEAYQYDGHHNVVEVMDARRARTRYGYDSLGRPVARIDALARQTAVEHDVLGRPIRFTYPDGTTAGRDYEPLGNPRILVDALGQTTHLTWTGTGVLSHFTRPDGQTYRFEHDSDERMTAIVNPRAEVHRFDLDARGHVEREVTFDGRVLVYRHALSDELSRVDYPDETFRELVRDALGNVIADQSPHGTITYDRDALGRLQKAVVDEHGGPIVTELERDRFGRVVAEIQGGRAVRIDLDATDRRVTRTLPDGQVTRYRYDAAGELSFVEHAGQRIDIQRDVLGREVRRRTEKGHLEVESSYDAMDRLLEQKASVPLSPTSELQNVLAHRTHGYDSLGRVTTIDDGRWGRTTYRYDAIGQLLDATRGKLHEVFEYDPTGSLVSALSSLSATQANAPWRLDAGNLLSATHDARYENDVRGRRVRRIELGEGDDPGPKGAPLPGNRVTDYVWDCRDRLREVRLPTGEAIRFTYDAFGRRVRKEVVPAERSGFATALRIAVERGVEALPPVRATTFLWDQDVLCEDRAPDGSARVFVHEPDTFIPLLQEEQGQVFVYLNDHLGTPRELVDSGGKVAWAAAHTAWGRVVETWRDTGVRRAVESPFRLPGQYHDSETGLCYTRFRYFEAFTGRWLSPDPLGVFGGINLLAFDGSPTVVSDPLGLESCTKKKIRDNIERLRKGQDVEVSSMKEARALLDSMTELRPHTFEGRMPVPDNEAGHSNPFWKQPRGTYRGDLINKQGPEKPIHPNLPEGHPHRDFPHYNIVFHDGTKAAIIIK